jgi:hypothetical protein
MSASSARGISVNILDLDTKSGNWVWFHS